MMFMFNLKVLIRGWNNYICFNKISSALPHNATRKNVYSHDNLRERTETDERQQSELINDGLFDLLVKIL